MVAIVKTGGNVVDILTCLLIDFNITSIIWLDLYIRGLKSYLETSKMSTLQIVSKEGYTKLKSTEILTGFQKNLNSTEISIKPILTTRFSCITNYMFFNKNMKNTGTCWCYFLSLSQILVNVMHVVTQP